jgi:hypothetical protein
MATTLESQEPGTKVQDRREAGNSISREMSSARITMELTPEFYAELKQLMSDTRQDLEDVYNTAIALYKTVVDLKRQGKHVGVTDDPAKLDREFVGLGSPESGL